MKNAFSVCCPICKIEVPWNAASHWRPFCSARCQSIDLGDWASDRYAIASDSVDETSGSQAAAARDPAQ